MSHRRFLVALGVLLALAMFSGAMIVKTTASKAHDFYPHECCHDQDCAPAKVEIQPTPAVAGMAMSLLPSMMVVTTVHGSVVVPANFKTRDSPDGQVHACIMGGRLICLFMPPSM